MSELITVLAGVASLGFLAYAVLTRNSLASNRALLADSVLRYEALQKHAKQAEQQAKLAGEQSEKLRSLSQALERQNEDLKQKLSDRTNEIAKVKAEKEEGSKKVVLQNEHLKEQVQVLTQQLAEAVREKKQAQDEMQKLGKDLEERVKSQADGLRQQMRELQQQLQNMKKEKHQVEGQLEKLKQDGDRIKPEELKRYKLRAVRLEQLYVTMKGLRELAEERNKNWETALRYFAGYILGKTLDEKLQSLGIGVLVGEALEKIGATLVYEIEEAPQRQAAEQTVRETEASLLADASSDRAVTQDALKSAEL